MEILRRLKEVVNYFQCVFIDVENELSDYWTDHSELIRIIKIYDLNKFDFFHS